MKIEKDTLQGFKYLLKNLTLSVHYLKLSENAGSGELSIPDI